VVRQQRHVTTVAKKPDLSDPTLRAMAVLVRQPSSSYDEVLARAGKLVIGQAAYRAAAGLYPGDLIELRQGARVIETSQPRATWRI
jgi:hypothetical protein